MLKKLYHIELDETTEITEEQLQALQTMVPDAHFHTKEEFYGSAAEYEVYCQAPLRAFRTKYNSPALKLFDLPYFLSMDINIPFRVLGVTYVRMSTRDGRYNDNTLI